VFVFGLKYGFNFVAIQVTEDEAPGFVRDVGADKVEFKFKKPKSIEIGGSYSIGCIVKPDINVDILMRLPKVSSFIYRIPAIYFRDSRTFQFYLLKAYVFMFKGIIFDVELNMYWTMCTVFSYSLMAACSNGVLSSIIWNYTC